MGSWKEDIYGNDDAQDLLGLMSDLYKSQFNISEIIAKTKKHYLYNNNQSKLVLADFEMDLSQNISNKTDIKNIIKQELDIDNLDTWTNPKIREHEINKFKNKLENYKNTKLKISNYDVMNWLNEKRGFDIL